MNEIEKALAAPFAAGEVKYRPGATKGERALALAYVDARVIQDRLDQVLGACAWQDEYEFLADGSVLCKLRLRIDGEWVTKMDVGSESEQKDAGDRRKAAVSDALKRAAVKFGIGRYLYRLPQQWVDYNSQTKQLREVPAPPQVQAVVPAKRYPTGSEVMARLAQAEGRLVEQGKVKTGEVQQRVLSTLATRGFPSTPALWNAAGVQIAIEVARECLTLAEQQSVPDEADASELVGAQERTTVARLLKEAAKTWQHVCNFLKLPPGAAVSDLTIHQFGLLEKALEGEIAKKKAG